MEGTEDLGIDDSNSRVTRFFGATTPLVFAHRGGCDLGPENTVPAFDAGAATGADGLELDVHLSRDGHVVVFHDSTLGRTTDATGPVAAYTAEELRRVDAAFAFAPERGYPHRGQGIGVPTLREVLARYPATRLIIEMKADVEHLGEAVAHDVRRAGAVERICLAGFGDRATAAARKSLPEAACSASHREVRLAVYRSMVGWPVHRTAYGGYQVPERSRWHQVVSPRFIRHAHRAGLQVQVWTVDQEADMRRLLAWGVDALISNRPDLAVRIRNEAGQPV